MKRFTATYASIAAFAAAFGVFLNTFAIRFAEPFIRTHFQGTTAEIALFVLSLSIFYSMTFAAPLVAYRKWLWSIFHPRVAFGGCWKLTIIFDACERGRDKISTDFSLPVSIDSAVEVIQDGFGIELGIGHS